MKRPVVVGGVTALALAGLSLVLVGALNAGVNPGGRGFPVGRKCAVSNLSGPVLHITVTNMGGSMMGQGGGTMHSDAMRLNADRATVPHGTVSFLVTNGGSVDHEMVILPLRDNQTVGTRPSGSDAKVDETGSLGEASNGCGAGAGQGIRPGDSGWLTITLTAGRYELLCNLPGHYAAGMYTQLTVT